MTRRLPVLSLAMLAMLAMLAVLLVPIAASPALADGAARWIHVRVQEEGGAETVRVSFPLELVANLLPLVDADELRHGVVHLDDAEWRRIDLASVLRELRAAPDAEFVTIATREESVRVRKRDGLLEILVEDGDERVTVRVPMAVAEAMVAGSRDRLDLAAGLRALGEHGTDGDLVTIESEDTRVRVWIDRSEHAR